MFIIGNFLQWKYTEVFIHKCLICFGISLTIIHMDV